MLARRHQLDDGRALLVGSALLGLVALLTLERVAPDTRPHSTDPPTAAPVPLRVRIGGLSLMVAGALLALVASVLILQDQPSATTGATALWVLALAATADGALLMSGARWPRRLTRPARMALLEAGLLLLVLAVAVALRLPDLASIPAQVHGDEAAIGLGARDVLTGAMPSVFGFGWYEVPALSFSIAAASMLVFGDDLFGLRMASLLQGVLSIGLLYLLARRLWGGRPALLAAALMAISAWHIHFSRTGFHYMQAVVATLLVLYFVVRAAQDRRILDWVLCGFAIGLCVEVYYAARIAPVLAAVYLGYRLATERAMFVRTQAAGVLALILGAVVFLAPMAAEYVLHPHSFYARTAGVMILGDENLRHELDAYHVSTLPEVLLVQLQHTVEAFNIRGETSLQYGNPTPLLDPWTGALLAVGALGLLLRPRGASGALLVAWVWIGLAAGSVLTLDALFSPRVLLTLPGLLLGPALVLDAAWRGASGLAGRARVVATVAVALTTLGLLGAALVSNVHDYFDLQVKERLPPNRFTLLARYAETLVGQYRLYTVGRGDWTLQYETPRFLVPHADAVNVRDQPLPLPLDRIPAAKGVAFLVENQAADYGQRISAIQRVYPRASSEVVFERPGSAAFTVYRVEPAELVDANPNATRD